MTLEKSSVLTMNGGSSSIKFALYQMGDPPKPGLHGKVDRIGLRGTTFSFNDPVRNQQDSRGIGDLDHRSAANYLFEWLDKKIGLASITAVGHRIVNGGANYHEPQRVLGIQLDENRNTAGEVVISAAASQAQVRVIRTDEYVIIAKAVFRILAGIQPLQHTHGKE